MSAGAGPSKPPLVLCSGMLGDASLWSHVIPLVEHVTLPETSRIDLDDDVRAMAARVLRGAPARFALAGHSLGAIVALEVMRQEPQRVACLAVLNGSARAGSSEQRAAWSLTAERVLAGEFDAVAAELAMASLPLSRRDDADLVSRNAAMARTVGPGGLLRQLRAQQTRPDARPRLAGLRVPVLVISGELDEVCPPAMQEEIAALCPTARLARLAHTGHMAPLESPEQVAELLAGWLSDVL